MQIPAPVRSAGDRWGVIVVEPAHPGGHVWFGLRGDEHVIVKYGDPDARRREAIALRGYSGGASRLLASDDESGTLLTERLLLGYDLMPMSREDDDEATRIIARTLMALHRDQLPVTGLPDLAGIGAAFDAPADPRLPSWLTSRAAALLAELVVDDAETMLHGDLHHLNVLRDGDDWRAIDPHGWMGDPVFDAAAMMANPRGMTDMVDARGSDPAEAAGRARRRIAIVSEVTGFDRGRITAWAFVAAVIAELWLLEDHDLVHGAPRALALGLAGDV